MNTLSLSASSQLRSEPATGVVDRPIGYGQPGRVKYRGTYWSAQLYQPDPNLAIPVGASVKIMAMQGIKLLVVPVTSY